MLEQAITRRVATAPPLSVLCARPAARRRACTFWDCRKAFRDPPLRVCQAVHESPAHAQAQTHPSVKCASRPAPSKSPNRYTGQDITSAGRFASAAAAGSVSALIGSPTELIIIQQQVGTGPDPGPGPGPGRAERRQRCAHEGGSLCWWRCRTTPGLCKRGRPDWPPQPQKKLTPLLQEAKHFFSTYSAPSIYRGLVGV